MCIYNIHDRNIFTGWSPPVQFHVAPSSPIIAHASVKVMVGCANRILQQSFQQKKSQCYLDNFLVS